MKHPARATPCASLGGFSCPPSPACCCGNRGRGKRPWKCDTSYVCQRPAQGPLAVRGGGVGASWRGAPGPSSVPQPGLGRLPGAHRPQQCWLPGDLFCHQGTGKPWTSFPFLSSLLPKDLWVWILTKQNKRKKHKKTTSTEVQNVGC